MTNEDMIARLIAQAESEGADLVTLRAVVEESSDLGAQRVLARIGLDDETAHGDLLELRQLLRAWRDAKTSAWKAAVDWVVRGLLALVLVSLAYRFGLSGLIK